MSHSTLLYPVLIIDDEQDIRQLISITLNKMGLKTDTAENVQSALAKLKTETYSLILTDMRLPDGNGLEIIDYVSNHTDTPIAMITAYGNADHAVLALKSGAFDYIQKPITLAQLRTLVKSAIKIHEIDNSSTQQKNIGIHANDPFPRLLGNAPLMQEIKTLIQKIANTHVSVLITGESGTGKEQAARSIHELSNRKNEPFVAINCGAIPENLMESEFFGYKKGSFTGADQEKDGFFHAANHGTLFLDEIADLPMQMQVKLLRVIQEKAVRKIGEHTELPIDVRIITATHKNLVEEVEQKRFRQDLFYRLNVVSLTMPSLRDLREDLPFFIENIIHKITQNTAVKISDGVIKELTQYNYPGNFRELENILERAIALSSNDEICQENLQIQNAQKSKTNTIHLDSNADFVLGKTDFQYYLDQVEKNVLLEALEATNHNRTKAAKLLGISFRSIRYRLDRLDIH